MHRALVLALAALAAAATPVSGAQFICELADERVRQIEIDSNTDEREFQELFKRAEELGARALNQRQSEQLTRLRQDLRFIRKVTTARMAELRKEMERMRRANCADTPRQEALAAKIEAAAQKIMQGAVP